MNDRSHIYVILDRTRSMESIRADVVGGYSASSPHSRTDLPPFSGPLAT